VVTVSRRYSARAVLYCCWAIGASGRRRATLSGDDWTIVVTCVAGSWSRAWVNADMYPKTKGI
jgi:hypothetical protein